MSAAPEAAEGTESAKGGGGKKKLVLLAVPLVLAGVGAGLWFTGILPPLLGMGPPPPAADAGAAAAEAAPRPPAFFDMPEIVTNLNASGRRPVFVKLRSKLEITRAEDSAQITAAMPRLLDLFQTYLRETRPEELRGSAGTHRLREELIARANIALSPPPGSTQPAPRVTDVLFVEILVQ
ncbi:flagellar basal body-associated FliL family protein [Roseomonas sp. CECT 9278]|uniref:flagellar basal body-associated FliL family protein n=1 Tax=Roseomonas sp. CECT 9278 TaxID=2845823 RepID=UPI001E4D966C|nr:flagellar basal body-associated FliL family protein [Roseomonas sp. CECT 9278]CAH0142207.1 Flagellar FliL protein [Roseomonas sp. CECT 9278]